MSIVYTQETFLNKIEQAAQDISFFYQQDFVNYRGRTGDTSELYTELAAQWCIDHFSLFDKITQITREAPYRNETRDGNPANPNSNRTEELIAMALYRQRTLPIAGKVLDYQTPLKNKRSDRAGKIDLLAYDGKILRLLELKEPDSQETLLRCILEGFTYLKTVNQKKLLENLELPVDTRVTACPLVFKGSQQYQEMQEDRPCLKQLAELLDSHPLYLSQLENGKYDIL